MWTKDQFSALKFNGREIANLSSDRPGFRVFGGMDIPFHTLIFTTIESTYMKSLWIPDRALPFINLFLPLSYKSHLSNNDDSFLIPSVGVRTFGAYWMVAGHMRNWAE